MSEQMGSFSCKGFYGNTNLRKLSEIRKSLEQTVTHIKEHTIPTSFKTSICGPPAVWNSFYRQSDAFDYAHKNSKDVCVYAYESGTFGETLGPRMYLVVNNLVFWHYYSQLQPQQKHHYEVIPQGAVCKLYFDLEFDRSLNPGRDGDHMVGVLIKYVCARLLRTFNVTCQPTDVLDLCASTQFKFSRHLIFLMPNAAFKDNIHAGNFVLSIMNDLQEHLDDNNTEPLNGVTNEELRCITVCDKHDRTLTFCDLGVYTKNRNFRLYQSSKLKKTNPLVLAPRGLYSAHSLSHLQIFLDSLIHNVRYTPSLNILTFESNTYPSKSPYTEGKQQSAWPSACVGRQLSPYPQLDEFITDLVTANGTTGYIRCWTYFSLDKRLVYDIARYRWCGNIGRQHKSNNIMYIVDLKAGVYYQKCHDPQCRRTNYKSSDFVLPSYLLLDDDWEDDIDDNTLVNAAHVSDGVMGDGVMGDEFTDGNMFTEGDISDTQLCEVVTRVEARLV